MPSDSGFHKIYISFLEIYQEQIRDLLMPDNASREISIRESKGNITISGIHEKTVDTAAEMQK